MLSFHSSPNVFQSLHLENRHHDVCGSGVLITKCEQSALMLEESAREVPSFLPEDIEGLCVRWKTGDSGVSGIQPSTGLET